MWHNNFLDFSLLGLSILMYLKCPIGHSLEELKTHCFLMGSTNFQFEEEKLRKIKFYASNTLERP